MNRTKKNYDSVSKSQTVDLVVAEEIMNNSIAQSNGMLINISPYRGDAFIRRQVFFFVVVVELYQRLYQPLNAKLELCFLCVYSGVCRTIGEIENDLIYVQSKDIHQLLY